MRKNSIKLRISNDKNGEQIFKTIISHPMETGYRLDKRTGGKVPADYIEDFRISVEGETWFEMMLGEFVSKNPYLSFIFSKPLVDNQLMQISWVDNNERETSYDVVVNLKQDSTFNFSGDKNGSEVMSILPEAGSACKTNTPVSAN